MEIMSVGQFTNVNIVLSLIKKATMNKGTKDRGIYGRKTLQKSLYFLNQTNKVFSFRWADHGPFSGEIHMITEYLVAGGDIEIEEMEVKERNTVISNMQFSGTNADLTEIPSEIDGRLDEIVKFIAGKSPRDLELLASVHYLAVTQYKIPDEYTADGILEILTALKPDEEFKLNDVAQSIEILERHGFLPGRK